MEKKVVLITGASSGIGKASARALIRKGHTVYGAARRVERMDDLREMGGTPLRLDVTDQDSCERCVEQVMREQERIDVLFNNAGFGIYAAIEDVPVEEAQSQMDVNVFGMARMIRLVLPSMRKRRKGTIINTSSIAGQIQAPLGGWYHTTKHAVEGLSDCLRLEVEPFGVRVAILEPGLIRTEFYELAAGELLEKSGNGPYASMARALAETFRKIETGRGLMAGATPDVVARAVVDAVESERPKTRYVMGGMAVTSLLSKRFLSDRLYDRIMRFVMVDSEKGKQN